jgi:2-dehydro-3-deoxyphosphogluconate aldolase/(4S)-4-hydroxy-2-oxoglutarate aldolase
MSIRADYDDRVLPMTPSPLHLIPRRACLPVVTAPDPATAVHIASALHTGGLRLVELTLRGGDGFGAAAAVREKFPDMIVGLGTVLRAQDVARAARCGAHFIVSPGFTTSIAAASRRMGLPWLPGVATPSEVMLAREQGCRFLKFFPAAASGGMATLGHFAAVFRDTVFCATGGIGEADAPAYLDLPNVHCIGGSWIAPAACVQRRDWDAVTELARRAAALG